MRCDGDRFHASVINGPRGAASSLGNQTEDLAKTIIEGIEDKKRFEKQNSRLPQMRERPARRGGVPDRGDGRAHVG